MPKRDAESLFPTTSSIFPWALSAKGNLEGAVPLSVELVELGSQKIYIEVHRGELIISLRPLGVSISKWSPT